MSYCSLFSGRFSVVIVWWVSIEEYEHVVETQNLQDEEAELLAGVFEVILVLQILSCSVYRWLRVLQGYGTS